MSKKLVHFGTVKMVDYGPGKHWKLVSECGNIIRDAAGDSGGTITTNLAEVTCLDCQEENALTALAEFT